MTFCLPREKRVCEPPSYGAWRVKTHFVCCWGWQKAKTTRVRGPTCHAANPWAHSLFFTSRTRHAGGNPPGRGIDALRNSPHPTTSCETVRYEDNGTPPSFYPEEGHQRKHLHFAAETSQWTIPRFQPGGLRTTVTTIWEFYKMVPNPWATKRLGYVMMNMHASDGLFARIRGLGCCFGAQGEKQNSVFFNICWSKSIVAW